VQLCGSVQLENVFGVAEFMPDSVTSALGNVFFAPVHVFVDRRKVRAEFAHYVEMSVYQLPYEVVEQHRVLHDDNEVKP